MKLPPEPDAVVLKAKDMLILSDGTSGFIVEIIGDAVKMGWLGQLSREEEVQSYKAIQKWVSRGIWKLRRGHAITTKRKV